jgi:hypothetical protein
MAGSSFVDGAALVGGLVVAPHLAAPAGEPTRLGTVTGTMYGVGMIGAPVVHFAHGQTRLGFGSLGMRMLMPPLMSLGGITASCLAQEFDSPCSSQGAEWGFAAGLGVAAAVDAFVFAPPQAAYSEPASGRQWYGWQTLIVDAAGLGLGAYGIMRPRPEGEENPLSTPLTIGMGAWLTGMFIAPVVHFTHGNVGKGFLDFAPWVYRWARRSGSWATRMPAWCPLAA